MSLIPGDLYSCYLPSTTWTFYGLYLRTYRSTLEFSFTFCVNYPQTWYQPTFTLRPEQVTITHLGHPSDFPEFLI